MSHPNNDLWFEELSEIAYDLELTDEEFEMFREEAMLGDHPDLIKLAKAIKYRPRFDLMSKQALEKYMEEINKGLPVMGYDYKGAFKRLYKPYSPEDKKRVDQWTVHALSELHKKTNK